MNLDTILFSLPNSSPADVQEWLGTFLDQYPEGTQEQFFVFLRDNKFITELQYWDAINGSELSLVGDNPQGDGYGTAVIEQHYESDVSAPAIVEEPYEFIAELGVGAMGEVHIVRERSLRRKVALKFIKQDKCDARSKSRFLREALITAQLDHPNIVPIYQYDTNLHGNPAYTMKWIKGRTLQDIINDCRTEVDSGKQSGAPDLFLRLDMFLKLCEAMSYAHARKVIHRDLKPANVMLGTYGELYVMDWGIARTAGQFDNLETENVNLASQETIEALDVKGDGFDTQDGSIVGTIAYLSPEQARGEVLDLTVASDQFALGLILFELVTLNKGIQKGAVKDMLRRAQRGQIAPMVHYNPAIKIRPELQAIIEKATSPLPENRYKNVDMLAEDIRLFMRDEPVSVFRDPPLAVIMRWVSKHRIQAFALGIVLLIAGLSSSIYSLHREQEAREENIRTEQLLQEKLQAQNQRLSHMLSDVNQQSNKIAQEFLFYKGLLRELAAATKTRLVLWPEIQSPVYKHTDYQSADTAPEDLAFSVHYNKEISTKHVVIKLAPNVADTVKNTVIERELSSLLPVFQNMFMEGMQLDEDISFDQLDKAIRVPGTSMVWAYVGTEAGIHVAYPGKGDYVPEYDPRERPWYKQSKGHHKPTCLPPEDDAMGQGKILACTLAIYDASKNLLGVAGLDLSVSAITKELIAFQSKIEIPTEYGATPISSKTNTALLDKNGEVLAVYGGELQLGDKFPFDIVSQTLQQQASGYIEDATSGMIFFYSAVGDETWTYVVYGAKQDIFP